MSQSPGWATFKTGVSFDLNIVLSFFELTMATRHLTNALLDAYYGHTCDPAIGTFSWTGLTCSLEQSI